MLNVLAHHAVNQNGSIDFWFNMGHKQWPLRWKFQVCLTNPRPLLASQCELSHSLYCGSCPQHHKMLPAAAKGCLHESLTLRATDRASVFDKFGVRPGWNRIILKVFLCLSHSQRVFYSAMSPTSIKMKSYFTQSPALLYLAGNHLIQFLKGHKSSTIPLNTPTTLTPIIPNGTDPPHVRDGPKRDQANLL